jgi:tetratricopeptide (TPR) repeat protein
MSQRRTDLSLPADIGTCPDRFDGESDLLVYLVASEAGHPIKAEKAAYKALEFLHGLDPIDWVFVNFDAAEKSGHTSFDQAEIDLAPYRAFAEGGIIKGISEHLVDENMLCAALAFGMAAQPGARVRAFDDWYLRAAQRDALEELNAEGGKIALIDSVMASLLAEGSSSFRDFTELLSFIRLDWTDEDWLRRRAGIESLDPARSFAELEGLIPQYENILSHLAAYKTQACRFYEAAVPRVGYLVDEALRSLGQGPVRNVAFVIAVPWIATAASRLKAAHVSYVLVRPSGVQARAMLELPSLNPAEVIESNKKLEALFAGRHIPGRIEMLEASQAARRAERSNDWAAAGQALSTRFDFKRADECFARALELDPANAHALWAAGASAVDAGDNRRALTFLQKSAQIDPWSAKTWEALGCALDAVGRSKEAGPALIHSIYLEPKNGRYWNRLALHYHGQRMMPQACYAFKKGAACGDGDARDNFQTVFGSSGRTASCPPALRPLVIKLKNKLALRARNRRER